MKLGDLASCLRRFLLLLCVAASAPGQSARVMEISIDRVVHPLTSEIVSQGLAQAERDNAAAVLIHLNTPGGLLTATQQIIQKIIASPVPVITYVNPSGGRAASAGFMILIAADVAAMAPGTNTGAAHPVMMGGGQMDEVMKQKVGNDAAAAVRSMAQKRGRNPEVAEKAVLESQAFTEQEALDNELIEVIADDVPTLLRQLDGRTITRFHGEEQTLQLAGAVTYPLELNFRQRSLLPLTDPGVAFILLILGLVGVYIEFTHPGLILPGVAGGILLIVSLMALSLLPINWAGAALILLGLACFILEATITSGGILATGGVIAMVLGTVLLIDTEVPELTIGWGTAIATTLPFALISVFLLRLAVQSFRYKVATGTESMVGEIGIAKTDINADGRVFVHGEWWNAHSQQPISTGSKVRVVGVDGLLLNVAPAERKNPDPAD